MLATPLAATAQSSERASPEEMRRMQERMKAATATNEHHEALSYFLGDWDVEIELVMPGATSQKWRASSRSVSCE